MPKLLKRHLLEEVTAADSKPLLQEKLLVTALAEKERELGL